MILSFIVPLFLILGIWSIFFEHYNIKVEKIELEIKNLPSSFEGIKIVQLSDIHFKKFGRREKKVLEILKDLDPDLIFITGDLVDWTTRNLKSSQDFWKELSRNYPGRIFGVYGNHDHQSPEFKILKNLLKESKIEILNNESVILRRNDEFIYLLGVDDPHLDYDNVEKAMKDVKDDRPKILLAHSPEIFRRVKDKNISLILVGHTHGGQINIPFVSNLILPLKYDRKYKSGLFKENSTYLYINRGIGTTILPVRFNAFPEITLIKLKKNNIYN